MYIKELIGEKELKARIKELAKEIEKDTDGKPLLVLSILKGAMFFTTELTQNMNNDLEFDVMQLSSYLGTDSTGNVVVKKDIDLENIKGKDVLIIEDIIDTGKTMKFVIDYLKKSEANSIKVCTLLDKEDRRELEVNIDYTAFKIPNKFVIGFGLDYDEKYRNLPYIGYVENDD